MELTEQQKYDIITHAEQCFPEECCGVIVNNQYIPCKNDSSTPLETFKINQLDKDRAEDFGPIQAYVHSHPNESPRPSEYDRVQIELSQKPWVICSFPDCTFSVSEPCGYITPLISRNFHHGWQDCYSLCKDFYERELNILLPDFDRTDKWWDDAKAPSLYVENFKAAGFTQVSEPRYGDILLFSVRSTHTNHAGVYLANRDQLKSEKSTPFIGSAIMLHHMYGRQSNREMVSSFWTNRMTHVLRHKDLIDA